MYEKPVVLIDENLAEGVYAASGSYTGKCKSKYMQGKYVQGTYSPITDGYKIGRGCEGCPARWGDGCHVETLNYEGDFRPTWEVQNHLPDEKGY